MSNDRVLDVLRQATVLAQQYPALTGKPLGITGEVAEYEAARILGVQLTAALQAGYDAVEVVDGRERTLQIKGRCILRGAKKSQQTGSIDIEKAWDAVLLVLVDENFDAYVIYEAEREAVLKAILEPGSKGRTSGGRCRSAS